MGCLFFGWAGPIGETDGPIISWPFQFEDHGTKHSERAFVGGTGHGVELNNNNDNGNLNLKGVVVKVVMSVTASVSNEAHQPSSSSISPFAPRLSRTSRLPVELGSMGSSSMLPLHSAVASARLVSSLCVESLGWCLVPQGISMPL